MKKLISVLALICVAAIVLYAAQATVTKSSQSYGGEMTYRFTFTDGGTDSATIVPTGKNYFNIDEMNASSITVRYSSGETTTDSILWHVDYQVKAQPSHSWITAVTYSDSDATSFLHMISPATYGYWPLCRFQMRGGDAQNAEQAITLDVLFKED